MVHRIVLFDFPEGVSPEEHRRNAEKVKALMEALPDAIPGIRVLAVHIAPLPTSNKAVGLYRTRFSGHRFALSSL